MADWCGVFGKGSITVGGYGRRSMRNEDFEEEDVWSVVKETGDSSSNSKYPSSGPSSSSAWHLPSTAPRMIPATKTTATNHGGKAAQQQSSAPGLEGHSKGEILVKLNSKTKMSVKVRVGVGGGEMGSRNAVVIWTEPERTNLESKNCNQKLVSAYQAFI
ncbi:hypothetical protein NC651_010000 [Populus alba x Populus x berolinensis]|nr:hypothetical protein NC651_010000 [Populus alba x Populus x berolinensis]